MSGVENESASVRGPFGEYRVVPIAFQSEAEEKMAGVLRKNPWLSMLGVALRAIVKADVTHRKRYEMLRKLADRINAAVAPVSACSSRCDGCCHIQVEVTRWEAQQLSKELGFKLLEVSSSRGRDSKAKAFELMGAACGFLRDGQCAIYESRPLACRMHHSLGRDASMCQPEVKPEESFVPAMDMSMFWAAYAACSNWEQGGDLAEFFEEATRRPRGERCLGRRMDSDVRAPAACSSVVAV